MTWGSGLILQRTQYNALIKTQSANHNQQTTIANHYRKPQSAENKKQNRKHFYNTIKDPYWYDVQGSDTTMIPIAFLPGQHSKQKLALPPAAVYLTNVYGDFCVPPCNTLFK